MRPVIIVFAKAPRPGQVKTRLLTVLNTAQAVALHYALVLDQIELLQQLAHIDVELHTDITTDAWTETGVARGLQSEGDLQLKLLHALQHSLAGARKRVAIIGSDAPALPPQHVLELIRQDADVSLGPAEDGGFWGIACSRINQKMFDGVRWSRVDTLEQTIAACRACGLSVSLGPLWWDVDEPRDLYRLTSQPGLGRHVKSYIESPEWRASFAGTDPKSHPAPRRSR